MDVNAVVRDVIRLAEGDDEEAAFAALDPLVQAQATSLVAAEGLAVCLQQYGLRRERRFELAREVWSSWMHEQRIQRRLGEALESLTDLSFLNARPPDGPACRGVAHAKAQVVAEAGHRAGAYPVGRGIYRS